MTKQRCAWVTDDPIYIEYHDDEWGNLDRFQDDHYLFEMLTLEGAQAGLSWLTILKRRKAYREAFNRFDPELVAKYDEETIQTLLQNKGIIRNERKIRSTVSNAKAFLQVQKEWGSFHQFLWDVVGGAPIINHWKTIQEVPNSSTLSNQLSKKLKRRGFSFVGPVMCYSFLQAIGLVQDHTEECFLSATNKNTKSEGII